jgi:hypothetical protein
MAEERTDRHALPLLQAGQAQKELTHNEALVLLDMLAMAAVAGVAAVPPAAPVPGECWIVGPQPGGAWAGAAGKLACWTASGWRFLAPQAGMRVWRIDLAVEAQWRAGEWRTGEVCARRLIVEGEPVVGPRQPAIALPVGGATVDAEVRAALGAIVAALKAHGLIAAD